ncbi:S-locus lectin protein kinase family protein, partial [Striga asiatica]
MKNEEAPIRTGYPPGTPDAHNCYWNRWPTHTFDSCKVAFACKLISPKQPECLHMLRLLYLSSHIKPSGKDLKISLASIDMFVNILLGNKLNINMNDDVLI